MTPSRSERARLFDGTVRLFLAEALLLPTGIASAAYLARTLAPDGYGLFTLAATIVTWIQWAMTSIFARTVIKLMADADDWRAVAATALRLYLAAGLIIGGLLAFSAPIVADLLHQPQLAGYLRIFSIDIPLFALVHAHRYTMIGRGDYRGQSSASAGRWLARLALIVLFVELGLSVEGAIIGSIGATLVELAISRWHVRPSFFHSSPTPVRQLLSYALPLFLFALSMRLLDRLDIIMLQALGGSASDTGFYGAAQNLTIVPSLVALSFSPLLLSTIGRLRREGREESARTIGRDALRFVVCLLPAAAMASACSSEVIATIFGERFAPAAPLLSTLIFGGVAVLLVSVSTAMLTALDRPRWTLAVGAPLPFVAVIGHLLLIPALGNSGAAIVTSGVTTIGAVAALAALYRRWELAPPLATVARSVLLSAATYMLAPLWPAEGAMLALKLASILSAIAAAFVLLGELGSHRIDAVRSLLGALRRRGSLEGR